MLFKHAENRALVVVDDATRRLGPSACRALQRAGARPIAMGADPIALLELVMTLDEPTEAIFTFTENEQALERSLARHTKVDALVITEGIGRYGLDALEAAFDWVHPDGSILLMENRQLDRNTFARLQALGPARLDVLCYEPLALTTRGYQSRVVAATTALVQRSGPEGIQYSVEIPSQRLLA